MSKKSLNQIRFILGLVVILVLAKTQVVHAQQGTTIIKDRNSSTQADVVANAGGGGLNGLVVTVAAMPSAAGCSTATNCKVAIFASDGSSISAVTDPCDGVAKTPKPFSISSATTTVLVSASASNKVYICSMNIVVAGANNVALVEDATGSCASPDAGMAGGTTAATGWNFAANGGLTFGNGAAPVFQTASTNVNVCLITSGTAQTSGSIQYVVGP